MTIEGATLVLDVDGTLYEWTKKADYSPDGIFHHTQAIPEAVQRVAEAARAGWRVRALTGRGPETRAVTEGLFFEDFPDLYEARNIYVGPWAGWDAYKRRKAAALASMGNVVYVGDRREDAAVAALAGVGFMPADLWRRGYPFTHLLPHMQEVGLNEQ